MIYFEEEERTCDWYDRAMTEIEDMYDNEEITYEDYVEYCNELNGDLHKWLHGELRYYA